MDKLPLIGTYRARVSKRGIIEIPEELFDAIALYGDDLCTYNIDGCLFLCPASHTEWPAFGRRYHVEPRYSGNGTPKIKLTGEMRDYAGIGGMAVIVGACDHIEIWEPGEFGNQAVSDTEYTALDERVSA